MALIIENAAPIFDLKSVAKGDLIRARHKTWDKDDYRNGVIVSATPARLVVLYYAGYGNVTNHYVIIASEVADGDWEIKWTTDMETIYETGSGQGGGDGKENQGSDT